jgi:DNA-directed RNA polymerase beta' subunit
MAMQEEHPSQYDYGQADETDDPVSNKRLVKEDLAPKRISHLQFGLLSPSEMQRLAEFQVTSRELFSMPSRKPAVGGCLDPRLGISDKVSSCATCKRKLVDCAGHFGYIKLALPVFHIGFLRHTLHLLQCICKNCSKVLLNGASIWRGCAVPKQTLWQRQRTLKSWSTNAKRCASVPIVVILTER